MSHRPSNVLRPSQGDNIRGQVDRIRKGDENEDTVPNKRMNVQEHLLRENGALDYLNRPKQFNEQYEKLPIYVMLMDKLETAEKNLKRMGEEFKWDRSILKQIKEEGTKNYGMWEARSKKMAKRNGGKWLMDYIVACEKRPIGEISQGWRLVKYTNFPVPTWDNIVEGPVTGFFNRRLLECDLIEYRLRQTISDENFDRRYSERYLTYEDGVGLGGYVKTKAALYRNELRAIETEWNSWHSGPAIILEDWTGKYEGIDEIKDFTFITDMIISSNVREMIDAATPFEDKYCRSCNGCKKSNLNEDEFCCDVNAEISKDGEIINYACTDECEGTGLGRKCPIRKGRQVRLCIFRDHEKGWSVRVLDEMQKNQYLTQAFGELNDERSADGNHDFEMDTLHPNRDVPLTIALAKKGNEVKYMNHSCRPNIGVFAFMLERVGHWLTRKCFFTNRKIVAGEELLWDYFVGYTDEAKLKTTMFKKCLCGTNGCLWRKL